MLHFEESGAGEPVLLIHGIALDSRMWEPQLPLLGQQRRVIRCDLRGYGRSPLPDGPSAHHEDLRGLLDQLRIARADLVGLSFGAAVAIDFALQFPQRVSSLALLDPSLGGWKFSPEIEEAWRAGRREGIEAARKVWLEGPLFAHSRELVRPMVDAYSGWHWVNKDPVVRQKPPARERLRQLRAPTLVIAGALDHPDFLEIARTVAGEIRGARLELLQGVGHISNLEAPDQVSDLLLRFL